MSVSTVGLDEAAAIYVEPGCFFTRHIHTDIWESVSLVCCLYTYGIKSKEGHPSSHSRLVTTLFPQTLGHLNVISVQSFLHYTVLSSSTENPALKFRVI